MRVSFLPPLDSRPTPSTLAALFEMTIRKLYKKMGRTSTNYAVVSSIAVGLAGDTCPSMEMTKAGFVADPIFPDEDLVYDRKSGCRGITRSGLPSFYLPIP
jgi:hypothetical protein